MSIPSDRTRRILSHRHWPLPAPYGGDGRRWLREQQAAARRFRAAEVMVLEHGGPASDRTQEIVDMIGQPWQPTGFGWVRWEPARGPDGARELDPTAEAVPAELGVTAPHTGRTRALRRWLLRRLSGARPRPSDLFTGLAGLSLERLTGMTLVAGTVLMLVPLPLWPSLWAAALAAALVALAPPLGRRLLHRQVRTVYADQPYAPVLWRILSLHGDLVAIRTEVDHLDADLAPLIGDEQRVLWDAAGLAAAAADGDPAAHQGLADLEQAYLLLAQRSAQLLAEHDALEDAVTHHPADASDPALQVSAGGEAAAGRALVLAQLAEHARRLHEAAEGMAAGRAAVEHTTAADVAGMEPGFDPWAKPHPSDGTPA